ncbi:MAG: metal ABC transporter substrate-binding protein [bacterium]|nr:metal ABC transporter substrate-binding protein [bacterium]
MDAPAPPPGEPTAPPPGEPAAPPSPTEATTAAIESDGDQPPAQIIATTTIWADIAGNVACGGLADVESIIPPVADPHDFEPSMADRARLDAAHLIVENGLGLEQGLTDTLAAAEADGTPIFSAAEHMTTIEFDADMFGGHGHEDDHEDHDEDDHDDDEDDHDDHEDDHEDHDDHEDDHEDHEDDHEDHVDHDDDEEDHADHEDLDDDHDDHEDDHDDHDDDHDDHEDDHDDHEDDHDDHGGHEGHDHGSEDPHVWLDPVRVAKAVESLAAVLVDQHGLDEGRVSVCVDAYLAELGQLHEDITDTLATVPAASRKLLTNHDAFGYFADRYNFEVIGTVIPSLTTLAEPSLASLEALAELIEETGVPAIFSEYLSHHRDDVAALADRLEGVSVVSLYSGALGAEGSGAETYLAMMRANAGTIAEALGG